MPHSSKKPSSIRRHLSALLPYSLFSLFALLLVAWIVLSPSAFTSAQDYAGVQAASAQAIQQVPVEQSTSQPLPSALPTGAASPTRGNLSPTPTLAAKPTLPPQATQPAQPTRTTVPTPATGAAFANPYFQAAWDRVDGPVSLGAVQRPWVWGPQPGRTLTEPFAGLPGNNHLVQYFDKGRMEINNPAGDPKDPFYVTNGLLAVELISGQLQTGLTTYENRGPAQIDLASDSDDPTAPTYGSFNGVSNIPGAPNERHKTAQLGQVVRTAIDRQGNTQPWPDNHPDYGVRIAYFEQTTGHNIPDVFWNYLNQSTLVFVNGDLAQGQLFQPWFAVTGYPISEPYWAYVKVAGSYTDVLIQAYERRVLTYVPHLPSPFKVQMGNIGQHYYDWRYLSSTPQPTSGPGSTPTSLPQAKLPAITIDAIQPRTKLNDLNTNFCTITNRDQSPVRFDGWWLDSPKWVVVDRYYFPGGVVLQPGASINVHAGVGTDTSTDLYMGRTTVMWEGVPSDLAVLYDSSGREVTRYFPAAEGQNPPPGTNPSPTTQPGATTQPGPTTQPGSTAQPKPTTTPLPGSASATPTTGVPTPVPSTQATVGAGTPSATPTAAATGSTTTTPTTTPTGTATPTPPR